jgi:hypothetical protein
MNPIQTAYINALLADASYVVDIQRGDQVDTKFKDRLTPTQAAYLAANFTVLASIETPNTINPLLGTGFDAVVWQIKPGSELAGPGNANAGKIFVSMRGTQGGTDIADDITLASRGIPYDQIRDMVNWWLKNTAAVTNTEVKQIKVLEAPGLIGAKTFALDTPTTGTGLLYDINGGIVPSRQNLRFYDSASDTQILAGADTLDGSPATALTLSNKAITANSIAACAVSMRARAIKRFKNKPCRALHLHAKSASSPYKTCAKRSQIHSKCIRRARSSAIAQGASA